MDYKGKKNDSQGIKIINDYNRILSIIQSA